MDPATPQIPIDHERLADFCRRWLIREFALFGSVLRDDFRPDSDVDVMVSFEPDSHWSLLDLGRMEVELTGIFGRRVDLVDRGSVEASENWIRQGAVLESARIIYVA